MKKTKLNWFIWYNKGDECFSNLHNEKLHWMVFFRALGRKAKTYHSNDIFLTTNEGVNQERKKPKLEHENRPLC